MSQEADVTINGKQLSPTQSMTIRVAIEALLSSVLEDREHYGKIGDNYIERIEEIRKLIMPTAI